MASDFSGGYSFRMDSNPNVYVKGVLSYNAHTVFINWINFDGSWILPEKII